MQKGVQRLVSVEGQKILRLPVNLRMIRGEKLILHGRHNISASCRALEREYRDEDFLKKSEPQKPYRERKYGLGMDVQVTACSWNTNGILVWAWMLWKPYALGTRTELWFGHGCSSDRMLLEHERNYGSGTDALVTACSWNTNGIMVWAWMP